MNANKLLEELKALSNQKALIQRDMAIALKLESELRDEYAADWHVACQNALSKKGFHKKWGKTHFKFYRSQKILLDRFHANRDKVKEIDTRIFSLLANHES